MDRKENVGICISKLILAFLVIVCHFYTGNRGFLIYISRLAVPCFSFFSFYLTASIYEKMSLEKMVRRIYRLWLPMMIWGGVYFAIAKFIWKESFGINVLFWQCAIGYSEANKSFWFLSNQIILTLLMWIIFKFSKKENVVEVLLISVTFCMFAQYSGANAVFFETLNKYVYICPSVFARIVHIFPFAVLGVLFNTVEGKIHHRKLWSIVALCMVYIIFTFDFPAVVENTSYAGYKTLLGATVFSVAFILLPLRQNKYIIFLSKYTFGIYCVHMLVGTGMEKLMMIMQVNCNSFLLCIIIFLLSLLLSFLLSHIPFLNKYVM